MSFGYIYFSVIVILSVLLFLFLRFADLEKWSGRLNLDDNDILELTWLWVLLILIWPFTFVVGAIALSSISMMLVLYYTADGFKWLARLGKK